MAPGDSVCALGVHFGCVLDVVINPLILVLMGNYESTRKKQEECQLLANLQAAIGVSFMKIVIFFTP